MLLGHLHDLERPDRTTEATNRERAPVVDKHAAAAEQFRKELRQFGSASTPAFDSDAHSVVHAWELGLLKAYQGPEISTPGPAGGGSGR